MQLKMRLLKHKNKKLKDTKFGKFLERITLKIPELALDVMDVATSPNPIGAGIQKLKERLVQKADSDDRYKEALTELEAQELEFRKEVYEWEVKDRMSARTMYRFKSNMADHIANNVMTRNLFYISLLLIANIAATMASFYYIDNKTLAVTVGSSVGTTIGAVIGSLLQERNQVVGFFFGASHKQENSEKND
jgi:hypothetical protein